MVVLRLWKQSSFRKVGMAVPIWGNISGAGEGAARMGNDSPQRARSPLVMI